jgi:hypothetical protein
VIGGDPERKPTGVALDNWQSSPHLHWTFQHVADFLPTATISRGTGPISALPSDPSPLDGIAIRRSGSERHTTVGDVIGSTATDGWIVSHRDTVLTEEYFGGMTADSLHLLMSVSKSFVGMVVGALHGSGQIDLDAPLTAYVPVLGESGYAGATVRHLLDMRSGIHFSEDYLDPNAEVRLLEQAFGWAPRSNDDVPTNMYDYLLTLRQKSAHGGPFEYRSCEADVLGWVCEAASGTRMPELMSQVLWSRLGAQHDLTIGVDSAGTGMFDGGINSCLRDLVRFGSLFLRDGVSPTGLQIVPASWIADTFAGGPDSREAFAASQGDNRMPGGMYRNQCWFPYPGSDVLLCLGIHGQMIYVNRPAQVVAAKVSSWPAPQDARMLFSTIAAFDAVSAAVVRERH